MAGDGDFRTDVKSAAGRVNLFAAIGEVPSRLSIVQIKNIATIQGILQQSAAVSRDHCTGMRIFQFNTVAVTEKTAYSARQHSGD